MTRRTRKKVKQIVKLEPAKQELRHSMNQPATKSEVLFMMDHLANQCFLESAQGEFLDKHGAEWDVPRYNMILTKEGGTEKDEIYRQRIEARRKEVFNLLDRVKSLEIQGKEVRS